MKTQFPNIIFEHNPEATETDYNYTAHLEDCSGMVVQADSKENCIAQMLISIKVQLFHQAQIPIPKEKFII